MSFLRDEIPRVQAALARHEERIGWWAVDVGARGRQGDPIDRPVCLRCREEVPRG